MEKENRAMSQWHAEFLGLAVVSLVVIAITILQRRR